MRQRSKGFSTRYDKDLGGNHIEALRKQSAQLGYFKDYTMRQCLGCGNRKPVKGGTGVGGKQWRCADCKAKRMATPNDLGNRRDAGPIGGASVFTDGLAGKRTE